ncbi:MAG TPA: MXAN_5187 C-terminal domain-containing protein [Vicinamibacterales bacterium]|nr:MXAN_5187 C-terminal domain-containing protein [Vicinamibacterales bacterium]
MTVAEFTELERDLRLLEATLHQLESQYNMFFAGQMKKPPLETRQRVEGLLKRYDRAYIQGYADRFRLTTIQTRFTRFCELWDRGLRAREEGRPGPFQREKPGPAKGQAPPTPDSGPAPAASVEEKAVKVSLGDQENLQEKLDVLYAALVEARRAAGSADSLPYDRFTQLVKGQLARLQEAGSAEVVFKVGVQNGKVSFTAKAVKTGPTPVAR